MSCSSNNCSTSSGCTSCTCCHVNNVTIDNQLCVGGETVLSTSTGDGGALSVSSCCTQSSGTLVDIAGTAGQTALNVSGGKVALDPNSASGGALVVSNSATQSSDELVKITGAAGQTALHVDGGTTKISVIDCEGGEINGTAIGSTSKSAGAFTMVTVDPANASGGAIAVTNSSTQTSGNLVTITGKTDQSAVHVSDGRIQLEIEDSSVTDYRAYSQGTNFTTATGHLLVRSGIAVDGTSTAEIPSDDHKAKIDFTDPAVPISSGAILASGGVSVGGKLWGTGQRAVDDSSTASTGGLLVGGGAVIENNIILSNPAALPPPNPTDAGYHGEIRVHGDYMYLHDGSGWKRLQFVTYS